MLVLLPIVGLWGAVIANLGGILVRNGMLFIGEIRDASVPAATAAHDVAPLLASAGACGVSAAVGWVIPGGALFSSVVAGVMGSALFVGLLHLLRGGLTAADLSAIGSAVPVRARKPAKAVLSLLTHGD